MKAEEREDEGERDASGSTRTTSTTGCRTIDIDVPCLHEFQLAILPSLGVGEITLHTFVTALDATSGDIVLAAAFAWPPVKRLLPLLAAWCGAGEICKANHFPNRPNAIAVTKSRPLVVPSIVAHATQVVHEHRHGRVVLCLYQLFDWLGCFDWRRQRWVIDDGVLAKIHIALHVLVRRALPRQCLQAWQVVESREDRVDAIVLPAKRVLGVPAFLAESSLLPERVVRS